MFTHLHVHSFYSLLCGASSPEDLCLHAQELGLASLALTDTNSLAGALVFRSACQDCGIRPIFGVQLTASLPAIWGEPYALLLARDAAGYSEICRITSSRQLDGNFDLARNLQNTTPHIHVIASDLHLALAISVKRKRGLFVELAASGAGLELGRLALMVQKAASAGLACVITQPVYFARPEEYAIHSALRAIHERSSLAGLKANLTAEKSAHLKTEKTMLELFRAWPAIWERTQRVADDCQGQPRMGHFHFPRYICPAGQTEFEYLTQLCLAGLRTRYRPITPAILKQLVTELEVIEGKKFSGYFLAVWDIAQEASRRGIVTVGRGSAANSLVAYCLRITQVDPLKYGLFFERFLNPERADPPDVDLDFPWDQRDEMLQYTYQRFGPERVAMICTTIRLHGRSAVREAGRLLGLTEIEISGFANHLPHFGSVQEIALAKDKLPESFALPLQEEPWKSVLTLALRLENIPRHLSVHPGGMVIASGAVADCMSTERSAKGVVVTQYDMHSVEDSGFVKIDLLGQRGLAVIRDASRAAGVQWEAVDPYTDPDTKKFLREGKTMGCFYVESPAMRLLLRKLKCDEFTLLVAASSIIRPGVSNSGMMKMFVDRHLGRAPVVYAHPLLKPLLQDTYGVMVYQEDVIKVVHVVAGMSLGEADKLRRCMSKKRHWEKMETYKKRFFEGTQARGIDHAASSEIWRQIESFGGYAFCKAHSASYAQLSFQSVYLKAHYPACFMAAVLSNQGGFYHAAAYWEEARRMGLKLLPLAINHSRWQYQAEGQGIRMGFLALHGFSETTAEALRVEREQGEFFNLRELVQRVRLTREQGEILIRAGACDAWKIDRTSLMWELMSCTGKTKKVNAPELPLQEVCCFPDLAKLSVPERFVQELNATTVSSQAHALMQYRDCLSQLAGTGLVAAKELHRYTGQRVRVYGWLVTWRRTRVHKTNEAMKFLTLEDFTDIFEVTLFPSVYREYGHKLFGPGPYWVEGVVENDRGGITITAKCLENLGKFMPPEFQ